jgi:hypothetical protein
VARAVQLGEHALRLPHCCFPARLRRCLTRPRPSPRPHTSLPPVPRSSATATPSSRRTRSRSSWNSPSTATSRARSVRGERREGREGIRVWVGGREARGSEGHSRSRGATGRVLLFEASLVTIVVSWAGDFTRTLYVPLLPPPPSHPHAPHRTRPLGPRPSPNPRRSRSLRRRTSRSRRTPSGRSSSRVRRAVPYGEGLSCL